MVISWLKMMEMYFVIISIEDYLYYNTRLESPSSSKYEFATLYRGQDGNLYFKLNLQIRFK